MKNDLFYMFSIPSKKNFYIEYYNDMKNAELENELDNIRFEQIEDLYFLLDQYYQNRIDKTLLKTIKTKIEIDNYNIKGILYNYFLSFSSINKYTYSFLNEFKYDIKLKYIK